MYPITHIGIAAGGVKGASRAWHVLRRRSRAAPDPVDYRLVALGSLLPDLVDKPLKWFLFREKLPDDHTFGHTLLLPGLLLAAGAAMARCGDGRLLSLGLGCLTHPLVDPVVSYPKTLLWPALGLEFPVAKSPLGIYPLFLEAALISGAFIVHRRSETFRRWVSVLVRSGRLDGDACTP